MNIDIYSEYKIYYCTDGCRISQENSTPNDIVFDNFEYDSEFQWRGGKLLEEIAERLNQDYLQDFSMIDDKIKFSYFDYNTGEAEDITMKVERKD